MVYWVWYQNKLKGTYMIYGTLIMIESNIMQGWHEKFNLKN